MKIVAISDTHEQEDKIINLPDGDVLIHAGDSTYRGDMIKFEKFVSWLMSKPHDHKILIAGNHELGFSGGYKKEAISKLLDDCGIIYLEHSSTIIDGYKIFGSPYTPRFHDWEFNVDRGEKIAECWKSIPDDVNILVCHSMPYRILDTVINYDGRDPHQGCEELRKRIDQLHDLKAFFGGHLHLSGGQQIIIDNKIFSNCAMCDDNYAVTRNPIVVEI